MYHYGVTVGALAGVFFFRDHQIESAIALLGLTALTSMVAKSEQLPSASGLFAYVIFESWLDCLDQHGS